MISVLNVIFEERFGGPQFRVLQVAQRLSTRGFKTLVAMPKGDPTFANRLREAGVDFVEFPLVRLRQTLNPLVHLRFLLRLWPNVQALRRIIRRENIDLVHTNSLRHLQGAIAARLEGVALVWHLNDTSTPAALRTLLLPLLRRWADSIPLAAAALTSHYFSSAGHVRDRLAILYAPVDPERFEDPGARSRIRAELGIPSDVPVVCAIGNLNPGKGMEFLLDAAPAIRARFPRTRFLVVGGMGGNRPWYRQQLVRRRRELGLEDDFLLLGYRRDTPSILLASNIYVHPSESEACPMAVLEGAAAGLPVIATRVGGTPELVVDGKTGVLIDPGSPDQIATAVLRLLSDTEAAHRMGVAGKVRAGALFSLNACALAHARAYETALRRRRSLASWTPAPAEKGSEFSRPEQTS